MNGSFRRIVILCLLFGVALAAPASAQNSPGLSPGESDKQKIDKALGTKPYSPYADRKYPSRPLFGDTHLHTGFSMDAGIFGARLRPADAYRFARGEQVTASAGQPAKLGRALDFLVVTDHSDNMGFATDLLAGKAALLAEPKGREWYGLVQQGKGGQAALDMIGLFSQGKFPRALLYAPGTRPYLDAWEETIDAAETYNEPGRFTAFIGYEWTSLVKGANMHRNVIFRDGGERARQVVPFTIMPPGSANPVDLWKWMAAYEEKTGGSVLAIPHNGNLSNGIMFPVERAYTGKRLNKSYVQERAKWERLYEVTQTKGDAEAHPFLSPEDEFADFETWDKGNLDASQPKTEEMLEFEYARSALKNGLKLEAKFGTNPYKFGMVGSTDMHTGLSAKAEDNFFGKTTPQEPSPERMSAAFMDNKKSGIQILDWEVGASGFAAVWAQENTRKSIWDALYRKETYATTGTRMLVRFFGGWDFEAADADTRNPAVAGYERGVPMGGDLANAPEGRSPRFLVAALKDPVGANLDRIQIVKGWLDARGGVGEKVYDVVWAGDRQPDTNGKLPSIGNTVDVANATWTNTIGASELITVWEDPDFDPELRAFYYVRVIEIPTPRWTAYDARRFGIEPLPETRMTVTERAYTSPIWYTS
ncbi:MAG: DUF3604 domain-containing protein [Deltaproteobacteria bacterium]|jgi:hypothetical protein|nr:DUF3604 domain-containing protein [Deltaproteobacteria bacterium]